MAAESAVPASHSARWVFGATNPVIEMRGIGLRLPASSTASTKAAADRLFGHSHDPTLPAIPAHEDDEVDVVLDGSFPATYTSTVRITRFVGLHANPTGWLDPTPDFFSVDRSAAAVSVSVFGDSGNDELDVRDSVGTGWAHCGDGIDCALPQPARVAARPPLRRGCDDDTDQVSASRSRQASAEARLIRRTVARCVAYWASGRMVEPNA